MSNIDRNALFDLVLSAFLGIVVRQRNERKCTFALLEIEAISLDFDFVRVFILRFNFLWTSDFLVKNYRLKLGSFTKLFCATMAISVQTSEWTKTYYNLLSEYSDP